MLTDIIKIVTNDPTKITEVKSGTADIPRCFWCSTTWSRHDTGSQCPFR